MKLREEDRNNPIPDPDDAEFLAWLNKHDREIESERKNLILNDTLHKLFKDKVELMKLYGNFNEKTYQKEIDMVINYLNEVKKMTGKYLIFGSYQEKIDSIFEIYEEKVGMFLTSVTMKNKITSHDLASMRTEIMRKFMELYNETLLSDKVISSLINNLNNQLNTEMLYIDILGTFIEGIQPTYHTPYDIQFVALDLKEVSLNDLKNFILFIPEKKSKPIGSLLPFSRDVFSRNIMFTYNNIFKVEDIKLLTEKQHPIIKDYFRRVLEHENIHMDHEVESPAFAFTLISGIYTIMLYWISQYTGLSNIEDDIRSILLEVVNMSDTYTDLYLKRIEKDLKRFENYTIASFGRGSFQGIMLNK
ncbi:MAG: hypothetical protein N3A54_05205 [Patescibacteria group bacterium]|nr:hypothetical protein [Patescibacteria group bacterium]